MLPSSPSTTSDLTVTGVSAGRGPACETGQNCETRGCRIECATRSSPGAWRTSGRSAAAPSADHAWPPAADERAGYGPCAQFRAPTSGAGFDYRDSRIRQHGVEQCRELAGAPWAASLSPRHSTGRTSVTRQVVGQDVTASASLLADLLSALTVMDIFAMSYWLRSLKERKPSPSRSPSSTSCTSPNCASNSGPSVGSF